MTSYNPFQRNNPLDNYRVGTPVQLSVIVTQKQVYKEDSGFCVYYVENEHGDAFQIKGVILTPLILQHTYFVDGKITEFRGTKQLDFKEIHPAKPINKKATIAYLQTVKGLKSKAEVLYTEFGEDSIDMILNQPEEVVKRIKGIGKKSVESWHEQLSAVRASQFVIKTLLGYDLSIKQARKLHDLYGDEVVMIIEENPYRLSYEVKGYGFERCDRIARNMGFDPNSPFRVKEGIRHVLNQAILEGHCYLPKDVLLERAKELLRLRLNKNDCETFLRDYQQMAIELEAPYLISHKLGAWPFNIPYYEVKEMYESYIMQKQSNTYLDFSGYTLVSFETFDFASDLDSLVRSKDLYNDDGNFYLPSLYYAERIVTHKIKTLTRTIPFSNQINLEKALHDYCEENSFQLEAKQREAALLFAKEKGGIFVLTGSAGCGKSFTLKVILAMLEHQYKVNDKRLAVELLAPTGKASKVVTRSTNRECKTVHRGLEYSHEGFQINAENPFEVDVIVVDESSMLDIELAAALLDAIQVGTKLILLGDTQQLPSVGPGSVLNDIIQSGLVPCVKLDVVKRQNALSSILLNANNIIAGKMIQNYADKKDSFLLEREPSKIISTVIQSIQRVLKFPNHSHEDIQVLAPQKKGTLGTLFLNYCIQQTFYPDKPGELTVLNQKFDVNIDNRKESFQLRFKIGDKVIHIKNNTAMTWYKFDEKSKSLVLDDSVQGITNGECGVIENIYKSDDGKDINIVVKYEERFVLYKNNFEELDHSWALTIHKSQGSQWKALILPMAKQYYHMLDNNLFYTAYTRAESFNVVIGESSAVKHAITTHNSYKRYTGLKKRLTV